MGQSLLSGKCMIPWSDGIAVLGNPRSREWLKALIKTQTASLGIPRLLDPPPLGCPKMVLAYPKQTQRMDSATGSKVSQAQASGVTEIGKVATRMFTHTIQTQLHEHRYCLRYSCSTNASREARCRQKASDLDLTANPFEKSAYDVSRRRPAARAQSRAINLNHSTRGEGRRRFRRYKSDSAPRVSRLSAAGSGVGTLAVRTTWLLKYEIFQLSELLSPNCNPVMPLN